MLGASSVKLKRLWDSESKDGAPFYGSHAQFPNGAFNEFGVYLHVVEASSYESERFV